METKQSVSLPKLSGPPYIYDDEMPEKVQDFVMLRQTINDMKKLMKRLREAEEEIRLLTSENKALINESLKNEPWKNETLKNETQKKEKTEKVNSPVSILIPKTPEEVEELREIKRQIKQEAMYQELNNQIAAAKKANKQLREDNKMLIYRLAQKEVKDAAHV